MTTGRLRIGFLMDPLEGVIVHHDSTFTIMVEAHTRGHEVFAFEQRDLFFHQEPKARMRHVAVRAEPGNPFTVIDQSVRPLAELDVLFLRKDPPVDVEFIHATQLIELCPPHRPFCINSPAALRDANEKLFALRFPDLIPPTLVGRDLQLLQEFVRELPGDGILKPVDGFAGKSVFHLRKEDRNLRSMLETLTERGRFDVVVQGYLPESREGDKRILLLEGEPLGAVLRVPREDDVRANMAAGGRPEKTGLTARDREICDRLAPELNARGLFFTGIDVIGGKLIEVNVTSPTGICEVDALDGARVEAAIVDLAERKAGALAHLAEAQSPPTRS